MRAPVTIALLTCVLCATPARAQEPASLDALAKTFLDARAKLEAREQALASAIELCREKPADLRPALESLLSGNLRAKRADLAFGGLAGVALGALALYEPTDRTAAALARPFLGADCPDPVRESALQALARFGTAG